MRLIGFAGVGVRTFSDTASYIDVAKRPLWSLDFLASERSWTLPLLYKLPSDAARAWGQFVVSVACWLALATALATTMRSKRMTIAAFAIVLLFSCSMWVIQWDPVLLSESLSLSLTAGLLAAWVIVIDQPTWVSVTALLAVAVLWVFVRDTNAYVGLAALPPLAVWALRSPRARRPAAVLASGVVILFVLSGLSASTELAPQHRWLTPMLNVLGTRVLVDEQRTQWFADHGLPVTPKLRAQAGEFAGLYGPGRTMPVPLYTDPELAPALEWVRTHMRSTYARYLFTHPRYTLAPLYTRREVLISVMPPLQPLQEVYPLAHYRPEGARAPLPTLIDRIVFPAGVAPTLLWLVAIVAASGVALWGRGFDGRWVLPLVLLAVTPVHLLLVWHGDAGEVTRHAVVAAVFGRLALLWLGLLGAAAFLDSTPARTGASTPAAGTDPEGP